MTKLPAGKSVNRYIEEGLTAGGFRDGYVVRMTAEGIYMKPPNSRWSGALFTSWADILLKGAMRQANIMKEERRARRLQKRTI